MKTDFFKYLIFYIIYTFVLKVTANLSLNVLFLRNFQHKITFTDTSLFFAFKSFLELLNLDYGLRKPLRRSYFEEKKRFYNFFFISLYKQRLKIINWFMNRSLDILSSGVKFALHLVHFMINFELQFQKATEFFSYF